MRECRRRMRYVCILSSEFKDILKPTQKNTLDTLGQPWTWWNHRNNIFQPILLNDGSKEPEGSANNRTFVPEK